MFTSSADVFRTRQALGDLRAFVRQAPDDTKARLIAGFPLSEADGAGVLARVSRDGVRFRHPDDIEVHTSILLAAALPDDDFPLFLFATALALTDMLQSDDPPDTLYWNWEAFHGHYAMADGPVRAALMNGFRVAEMAGRIELEPALDLSQCLTATREHVLRVLDGSGERALSAAMLADADPGEAGRLWSVTESISGPALTAFRYLYERPAGLAPPAPDSVALIPFEA